MVRCALLFTFFASPVLIFPGRDIPRSSELNINVRLWTRMLGSGQLLGLNRTPATGSATFSQTNSEILSTSGAPTAVSVMGREGRYHPLNTSLTEPRQTNASTQVTSNRSSLTLTQLASRISHISNNEPNKSSHRRSSTISFSSILPRRRVSQPPYYITVRSPEVQSMTEPNADRQPEPFHFIFVPCERSSSTLSQSSDVSGQGPHRAISLTLSRQTSLKVCLLHTPFDTRSVATALLFCCGDWTKMPLLQLTAESHRLIRLISSGQNNTHRSHNLTSFLLLAFTIVFMLTEDFNQCSTMVISI